MYQHFGIYFLFWSMEIRVEGFLCGRVVVCKGVWWDVASCMTQLSSVHIVTPWVYYTVTLESHTMARLSWGTRPTAHDCLFITLIDAWRHFPSRSNRLRKWNIESLCYILYCSFIFSSTVTPCSQHKPPSRCKL